MNLDDLIGRVHCSDALDLMRQIPDASIDLVLTDPPYGLAGRVFDFPHKKYSAINELWDYEVPLTWLDECTRILKPSGSVVCFCGRKSTYLIANEALKLGWHLINDITWVKPDAPPCFTGRNLTETTERALWFSPSGKNWFYNLDYAKRFNGGINLRDVWTFNIERDERVHPAQKPIELMELCISLFSPLDGIVLDPFAGSGTTPAACQALNRRWIAGDSSPEYCAVMEKRLKYYTPNMFERLSP